MTVSRIQVLAEVASVTQAPRGSDSVEASPAAAHFKTLKYRPAFQDRFGSVQDARVHGQSFFTWLQHRTSSQRPRPAEKSWKMPDIEKVK
jgi:hypothetical protein